MDDPAAGVRFTAQGPFEVFSDQGFCHVASDLWRPNPLWAAARFLLRVAEPLAMVHPVLGLVALVGFSLPAILLFLAGVPLWLWARWGHRARADRSGLVFRGRRWNWADLDAVVADNVEWRETQPPWIAHAVVLDAGEKRWALLVPTFDRADELATQLAFLHRMARGTPDDLPPEIRAAVAAARQS